MNNRQHKNTNGVSIGRYPVPAFIYGTAWKEESTRTCVEMALDAGFRGIDTANQRKHYVEEAVGDAINAFIKAGKLTRQDLFLQTKYTFRWGQDHRLPYDQNASIAQQVRQSCTSSLEHLRTDYIDSYILHGPSSFEGLKEIDLEAWDAMKALVQNGTVRALGVSNVHLGQLEELYQHARIKPTFAQIRCYARLVWCKDIRIFCSTNGMHFQSFSLLTANTREMQHPLFKSIVRRLDKTPAQIVFRFALQSGMTPLTGTTNPAHMREDLLATEFSLSDDDMAILETISFGGLPESS
jgi:diketogulonate reductase-like aldo/keto reductase